MSRKLMLTLAMPLALLALCPASGWAQTPTPPANPPAAAADEEPPEGPAEVPLDALLKANGDIPDIVLGNADAKITIVEYASMSCTHCAHFHNKVLPDLNAKYIDTGKVRLIVREFPTSDRALVAAMLTRCAPLANAPALIDKLFHTQEEWAFGDGDPKPKLKEMSLANGLTEEKFDACLKDQALFDKLVATFSAAGTKFGINSTPTFFINGKRLQDSATMEAFDKVLAETP